MPQTASSSRMRHGVIQWASASCERLLGWQPNELVGRNAKDFYHPDDLGDRDETLERFDDSGEALGRGRVRCRDGGYRWMATRLTRVEDGDFVVASLTSIHDEMLAREESRVAQEELAASEAELRLLAENSHGRGDPVVSDGRH